MEKKTYILMLLVLLVLAVSSLVAWLLKRQRKAGNFDLPFLDKFASKVNGWWLLYSCVVAALLLGKWAVVVLFGGMSFWAMREFVTITPTRKADHRALFLVFFLCIPLQYVFVWLGMYPVYSVLIPSYIFLLVPMISAFFGDTKFFLTRVTQITASLLICVYSLSFAPALLTLPFRNATPQMLAGLLCFFLLITQVSGIFPAFCRFIFTSQHSIAPDINTSKTWEGFAASVIGTAFIGTALYWATPFPFWVAGLFSFCTAIMAFGGTLTLSAIKRDRGVRDYGTLITGHGGLLDRIDSICFSAPLFYHLSLIYIHATTVVATVATVTPAG